MNDVVPELGATVGEALLRPHRSYLPVIRPLLGTGLIKGMAHITGGGLTDNLPRILPDGTGARIDRRDVARAAALRVAAADGRVPDDDMLRTFNMGIGLIVVCRSADAEPVIETARRRGRAGRACGSARSQDGVGVSYS